MIATTTNVGFGINFFTINNQTGSNTGMASATQTLENLAAAQSSAQLLGNVTVEQALQTIESVLGIIAAATPTGIDNHVLAYVKALRKSPELVALLSADLDQPQPQALSLSVIMAIVSLVRMIQKGGGIGEIFQAIKDLLAKFGGGAGPQAATDAFDPQGLDFATIMAIIAAIQNLLALIGRLKGGGGLPGLPSVPSVPTPHSEYAPATENRCL